ncbi:hypothetical protein G7Z13_31365 [Streptomyces sp. JB150]|nr:hypothetical protein G7Z13_31365 [Streptomyces sp. JB150]
MLAGTLFEPAWKMLGHDADAPDATDATDATGATDASDEDRARGGVLLAATVQGPIFAAAAPRAGAIGAKAAFARVGAAATRRLTGTWPGRHPPRQEAGRTDRRHMWERAKDTRKPLTVTSPMAR